MQQKPTLRSDYDLIEHDPIRDSVNLKRIIAERVAQDIERKKTLKLTGSHRGVSQRTTESRDRMTHYFITKPVADITAYNCDSDYNMVLEQMVNIPKDVLENMRSSFVDQISKYNNENENNELI